MSTLSIEEFYGQSIGVKAPWKVSSVRIDAARKEFHVHVECESGVTWSDPETGTRAEIKDWQERTWRHLDTCEYQTIVTARVPRLKLGSGRTMMAAVPWAEPGGRFTLSFESHLIELLEKCRTVKGAAALGRITADQMDGVMARAVKRGLLRRVAVPLSVLGFDEKSYRKGQQYVTVLTDPEGHRVLDVARGRTEATAVKLLEELPGAVREAVKAVVMDMWPAYCAAAEQVLPEAAIVYDKFHISMHLNKAVDTIRRAEHRELSAAGDGTLKNSKYQWLRSRLDLRTRAGMAFNSLLSQDLRTATAWGLKENFRRLWEYKSWAHACLFLERWVEAVKAAGLKPMEKAAVMIEEHSWGVLNYIHHRVTNAAAEGLNCAIQGLKTAAKGLPNFESLRTRILFFLGKLSLHPA